MTEQEQYNELLKYRSSQPIDIINKSKDKIFEYFKNFGSISLGNMKENMNNKFSLFYAPLQEIRRRNMTCWPFGDGSKEIYVDEKFAIEHSSTKDIQITHEVLHGLTQMRRGNQFLFGHPYNQGEGSKYLGLDEATTQMFTELIEGKELTAEEDYMFFIKNVMKQISSVIGIDKLADQYVSHSRRFEVMFNSLTGGQFEEFAVLMNRAFELSKQKKYNDFTEMDQNLLDSFEREIQDKYVSKILNLKSTKIQTNNNNEVEYEYYLHGTSDDSPETLESIFNTGLRLDGDVSLRLESTLFHINAEDLNNIGLNDIIKKYAQSEAFNSVFVVKIPKDYLSSRVHRDGTKDMPIPLFRTDGNGNSVLTANLVQGVYNKRMNLSITNSNFYPLYNPNGMAYSHEQFNEFASNDRYDLVDEYKKRQLTPYYVQYKNDVSNNAFAEATQHYQNKFQGLNIPQKFNVSEYKALYNNYGLGQGSNKHHL